MQALIHLFTSRYVAMLSYLSYLAVSRLQHTIVAAELPLTNLYHIEFSYLFIITK